MSIGASARLKAARERQGLSLEELAQKAKLSPEELAELESGNDLKLLNWQLVKAIRLAMVLDLGLSSLLGEDRAVLSYQEWAMVLAALVEYSANKPGLHMEDHVYELIGKVRYIADPTGLGEI